MRKAVPGHRNMDELRWDDSSVSLPTLRALDPWPATGVTALTVAEAVDHVWSLLPGMKMEGAAAVRSVVRSADIA